jgi:hypothetical protein
MELHERGAPWWEKERREETLKYKNPWHNPDDPRLGPKEYENNEPAEEYKGFLIIRHKAEGGIWYDLVKKGVCVSQRETPAALKQFVDDNERCIHFPCSRKHCYGKDCDERKVKR